MDYQILFITLSLAVSVSGHGRLVFPLSRNQQYEGGPVGGGAGGANFVCRNAAAKTPVVTLTAGQTTTIKWDFGAAHVGDCALFLSYDYAKGRTEQKYFKIANFPDCNVDNKKDIQVNLPTWLPPGQAVMRWDWYGLHVYPTVEFYVQCVDVTVVSTSTKTPDEIPSYTMAGQYPVSANQAGGKYWNPFTNTKWKMEGPPCAPDISDNCCDTTGYTRKGFINSPCATSGTATTSAPTPAVVSPTARVTLAPTTVGATPVSECVIYEVKSGDTMTKIAAAYTADGHAITALQLCQFNKGGPVELSECDLILPGDNLVIPDPCTPKACKKAGSAPDSPDCSEDPEDPDSGVQVVVPSLVFLISLVALYVM